MKFRKITIEMEANEYGIIHSLMTLEKDEPRSGGYSGVSLVNNYRPRGLGKDHDPNSDYPDIEYSLALGSVSLQLNAFMVNDFRNDKER